MTERLSEISAGDADQLCECPHDEPRCQVAEHAKICTRPDGHPGPHVACGTRDCQVKVWDDDGVWDDVDRIPGGA